MCNLFHVRSVGKAHGTRSCGAPVVLLGGLCAAAGRGLKNNNRKKGSQPSPIIIGLNFCCKGRYHSAVGSGLCYEKMRIVSVDYL